jgi:N-terminal domain of reverse transcriptase
MTVQQQGTGASSDRAKHWHSIDWVRCHREVRRLQARIVKATQNGKHGKVKALVRHVLLPAECRASSGRGQQSSFLSCRTSIAEV